MFFSGKNPKRIISGLFFLLAYKHDAVLGQLELAKRLDTTDVTVRRSYREWLNAFPELFMCVVGKLEVNPYFRQYVQRFLHDLKVKGQ